MYEKMLISKQIKNSLLVKDDMQMQHLTVAEDRG